ncbi:glutathione binding-like protein [Nostoc linckia]|uniref:glutathione binding-like protein n=1 Tax=Nostoc linckia TaxID=92942 RepID=UPI000BFFDB05|nr:glutathione binding-like protein [Nostoc linckia]
MNCVITLLQILAQLLWQLFHHTDKRSHIIQTLRHNQSALNGNSSIFPTAGEVRQGPESARLYYLFNATSIDIDRANQKAEFILTQLNQHLRDRQWLEFERITIADIAVFPYVALAPDGKIALDSYPHILAWIERVKTLPGFIGMQGIAAPALV